MCCVRNHVEVKSEEKVIRGVQWSNQHMISEAVSCVNKVQLVLVTYESFSLLLTFHRFKS